MVSNRSLFTECVARLGGCNYDESDAAALEYGIQQSDYESDVWFDYGFVGDNVLELGFALDVGTDVLFVHCKATPTLLGQLQTLAHILGYDVLQKRAKV